MEGHGKEWDEGVVVLFFGDVVFVQNLIDSGDYFNVTYKRLGVQNK